MNYNLYNVLSIQELIFKKGITSAKWKILVVSLILTGPLY